MASVSAISTAEAQVPPAARSISEIFGCNIDVTTWTAALGTLLAQARARAPGYACICNVHSVVTASSHAPLREAINAARLATPDGMPLVWLLRRRGFADQERINGPDLMLRLCQMCAQEGLAVFLYGSTEDTLARLRARLEARFPGLTIAGTCSPPFRTLSADEEARERARINASGAAVVFVGLGCPKQELWMARNSAGIQATLVGVGAAFDYHAGTVKRAPKWMQRAGLEWLARLAAEPRRLFRRYFETNTKFLRRYLPELLARSRTPRH